MSFVSLKRLSFALSALCLLFFSALVEACPECEAMGMIGYAPYAVTTTIPCHNCHHDQPTSPPQPPAITLTEHKCSSRTITPYTSGTATYLVSSCTPTTITAWTTQNATCPGPVQASATTVYQNITQPALVSTVLRYVNITVPVTYTSYASGSPPATVTLPASTAWQYTVRETSYPVLSTVLGTTTQLTTGRLCWEHLLGRVS